MTALTNTLKILEGLAGKTMTNPQILNIINSYLQTYIVTLPDADGTILDVMGQTNEEKAAMFNDLVKKAMLEVVKRGSREASRTINRQVSDDAEALAIVDLENL